MPDILKEAVPVEELERGVRAGMRSNRSPIPFRNWTANTDRGYKQERKRVRYELK